MLAACLGSFPAAPLQRAPSQVAVIGESRGFVTPPCRKTACIYVGNAYANSVTVYPANANGNVAPVQTIRGPKTLMKAPYGIHVGATGNVYVADQYNGGDHRGSVRVFAAGASGDVAPIKVIGGSKTDFYHPVGLTVSRDGTIYTANIGNGVTGGIINVYGEDAHRNVAPIRSISGPKAAFDNLSDVALDANDNVYAVNSGTATQSAGSVAVFAAGSNGDVAPIRTISGSKTKLDLPDAIALDSLGNVYVANATVSGQYSFVTVYPANAGGNVVPIRTIRGTRTELRGPGGIAVDAAGNVYVVSLYGVDGTTSLVLTFGPGQNGNVAPIRVIGGSNTRLDFPTRLAVH